jgi:hypothetical protein
MSDETVDATFHVQIEPYWSRWETTNGAKVSRFTLNRPEKPKGGTVTVKLTVRLPKVAFEPLRPEAVIEIPPGLIAATPIEVIAKDPSS